MNETTNNSLNANFQPEQIDAITLFVENLEVSRQFYQRIFNKQIIFEDANSCVFKFGGTLINLLDITQANELIEPALVASKESGSRFVFTMEVDNVDLLCNELTSHGVNLLNGPMDRPWGIRSASFRDPAGYIWEIAHAL